MLKSIFRIKKPIVNLRNFSNIKIKKKIAVALSGGVDSSAIAFMLKEQGHDLVGVFMRNWDSTDEKGESVCTLTQDRSDALEVCKKLNIPFHEVDFSQQYWNDVFIPFLESYSSGKETPNPDVFCNRFVKFYHFKRFVFEQLKVDALAMGHYVKINNTAENLINREQVPLKFDFDGSEENLKKLNLPPLPKIYKGIDPIKDQTYFLSLTPGHLFYNVLFPLGNINKVDVKAYLASRFPESNALKKKESMGICFIGKRSLKDFLSNYIDLTPGRFIDIDTNKILGNHEGIEIYTLGQKARIGNHNRYYIVKRITTKEHLSPNLTAVPGDILISTNNLHPYLLPSKLIVPLNNFNWIGYNLPLQFENIISKKSDEIILLHVKIRHTIAFECKGQIQYNEEKKKYELILQPIDELKFKSINPGQILTIYNSETDECYGATVISSDYLAYNNL